ncbi:fumarylacetoacetate hydrolase family protein [Chlorobium sp.]|jgi:fumarylpyruvate hydrolase|uniref:fumarylacetoacetate hydrolase family protein n=1 Tax=Chlorobium sp. TaxID=1095 RepID=UPI003C3D2B15|nr:fumarylacetoacetate hydrolase family protein [Chlorobiaceae bacterium]NTW93342.1 fumarylacetoacetate hydrolase family protein [Chlorobiaceae bacterium]
MTPLIDVSSIAPGTIYCIAKNYRDHAREMQLWEEPREGNSPEEREPVVFLKPPSALETGGITMIPVFEGRPLSENLHYEAEIVLLMGADCDECTEEEAMKAVKGYGVGLDMTLRDVQLEAKKQGNPWLKSKGFRKSALVSDFVQRSEAGSWRDLELFLDCNGKRVQHGSFDETVFSPPFLVHYLSSVYGLRRGDLIFTGTPAGVGRVVAGDVLEAKLCKRSSLENESYELAALRVSVLQDFPEK